LQYNAVKVYQYHDSDSKFSTSQNGIFNVHEITTSGGKFDIFLTRTRTRNNAQNSP